jgi:parvulin-like peptidyl-prolyl isomerase
MEIEITQKLDRLANYQAQKQYLELQKKELLDQILPAEIRARIEEVEAEFSGRAIAVDENIQALEEEIKNDLLMRGETAKGSFLAGVWCHGRVSWDTRGLDRYASSHPEILRFRKQGEPYVAIRDVKAQLA